MSTVMSIVTVSTVVLIRVRDGVNGVTTSVMVSTVVSMVSTVVCVDGVVYRAGVDC